MKYISIICLVVGVAQAAADSKAFSVSSCIDYSKPQEVLPKHFWDGKIHLVPIFEPDGKTFKGYVIVHMPKGSPYLGRGFHIGDVLLELDGVKATAPEADTETSKFLDLMKIGKFKTVKFERCEKFSGPLPFRFAVAPKLKSTPCEDYSKTQDVPLVHHFDDKISLVPIFKEGGKTFNGYGIGMMSEESPYLRHGFRTGDILTQLDETMGNASDARASKPKFFEKLKVNTFKTAKLERCQRISL